MNKLVQAARQALEALEGVDREFGSNNAEEHAITALREALDHSGEANKMVAEQAEQEPVAFWNGKETAWFEHELCGHPAPDGCTIPLYAAPVRTKDLTDDEKLELARSSVGKSRHWLVEAAIAADREKNNANNNT